MQNFIAFRDQLLPASEGFIPRQYCAFQSLQPLWVGSRLIPPSIGGWSAPLGEIITLGSNSIMDRAGRSLWKEFGWLPPNFAAIKARNPKLIHANFGRGGALALSLAVALDIPLIVTYHGGDASKNKHYQRQLGIYPSLYLRRLPQLMQRAAAIICVSEFIRDCLIQRGFPASKLIVHSYGIETSSQKTPSPEARTDSQTVARTDSQTEARTDSQTVANSDTKTVVRGESQIEKQPGEQPEEQPEAQPYSQIMSLADSIVSIGKNPYLFFAGRLVEKKGIAYLLEAFGKLQRQFSDLELVIAGSGDLLIPLQAIAATLTRPERVRFIGWQTPAQVAEWQKGAVAVVAPSVTSRNGDAEGLPNVVLEAMAQGCAIVATRHAGIKEAIVDGVSGLLVNERDSDALAASLARLIEQPKFAAMLGAAAKSRVSSHYNVTTQSRGLEQIFINHLK